MTEGPPYMGGLFALPEMEDTIGRKRGEVMMAEDGGEYLQARHEARSRAGEVGCAIHRIDLPVAYSR